MLKTPAPSVARSLARVDTGPKSAPADTPTNSTQPPGSQRNRAQAGGLSALARPAGPPQSGAAGLPPRSDNPPGAARTRTMPAVQPRQPQPAAADTGHVAINMPPQVPPGEAAAVQSRAEPNARQALQAALDVVTSGASPSTPEQRMQAHDAAVKYGQASASLADVGGIIHSTLSVAMAAGLAFGAGRGSGLVAGTQAAKQPHLPQTPTQGDRVAQSVLSSAAQGLLGAAAGGMGSYLGAKLFGPLVNAFVPAHITPLPANVVLPDEIRTRMNEIDPPVGEKPGAGDRLLAKITAQQAEAASIDSQTNVAFGKAAFDAATAARAMLLDGKTPAAGTAIGASIGVSAAAGATVGAMMGTNKARTKVEIPTLAGLEQAAAAKAAGKSGEDALKEAATQPVPLFYARNKVGEIRTTLQKNWDSLPALGFDAVKSMANRAYEMGKATAVTVGIQGATAVAVELLKPMDPTSVAMLQAVGNAVGIHQAIEPWFQSLAQGIPQHDNAVIASHPAPTTAPAEAAGNAAPPTGSAALQQPPAGTPQATAVATATAADTATPSSTSTSTAAMTADAATTPEPSGKPTGGASDIEMGSTTKSNPLFE